MNVGLDLMDLNWCDVCWTHCVLWSDNIWWTMCPCYAMYMCLWLNIGSIGCWWSYVILELSNGIVVLNCWKYMWWTKIYYNVYVLLIEYLNICCCWRYVLLWLNVDMCYWDCALCSCWWGDVLLELRNEMGVVELSPCMGANCEIWLRWKWVEMMITWCYDEMWKYECWWRVNYSLHLCLLNFENESMKMKATPKGRELPHVKKIWGGDSRKKKKRNVYGGDSRNWMMIWWGLPQEKGWDSSNVRGCEFDKQTWKRRKLALHGFIHG